MTTKAKPSYYGAFFWVAAVSFVVPLFVAARAFQEVPVTTKPVPHPDASGVDHNVWDYLLKTYVDNGLIDYDGMSRDYLFRTYLRQLAECEIEKLTTNSDRLALLINSYNAFVINGVITHHISDSVMNYDHDGKQFFDLNEHIFAGRTMSLNHIEHEIIRKGFAEPRIHVALVCAARSCPSIRAEAFTGSRLSGQLADQSNLFANTPKYVSFDREANRVQLNPILNWYGEDWKNEGGYLAWLEERVTDESLKQAIAAAQDGSTAVDWFDYDWSLNTQATPGATSSKPKSDAGFGSGSVPNE
ncbi:MAG: DUF547 domain-containing protein [Fuerstiella sp.]